MNPKNKDLAYVLRSCRAKTGLTLREVERLTGISNAYLSQLENGRTTNPSPRHLERLAEILKVSYFELMDLAGYQPPRGKGLRALEVAKLASDLNLEEQQEVTSFIQEVIARRNFKLEKKGG